MEIHPVLVHFPLVLLPLSVAIDLAAMWRGRAEWHPLSYAILVASALFAVGAVVSGNDAAANYRSDGSLAPFIERHEDWGTASLVLLLINALGRLPFQLQGRAPTPWVVVAVGTSVILWIAAYYGGELVYDHGVGIELTR